MFIKGKGFYLALPLLVVVLAKMLHPILYVFLIFYFIFLYLKIFYIKTKTVQRWFNLSGNASLIVIVIGRFPFFLQFFNPPKSNR